MPELREASIAATPVSQAILAERVLEIFESLSPQIMQNFLSPEGIELKADATVVTKTDKDVEEILIDELQKLIPGSYVLGEETATADWNESLRIFEHEYVWAVDPIDGTGNFANGIPLFAVSVGLLQRTHDGLRSVQGMVMFPPTGEVVYNVEEEVFLRVGDREQKLELVDKEFDKTSLLLGPDVLFDAFEVDRTVIATKNIRSLGCTAANIVYCALGRGGATLTAEAPWDFAGGLALSQRLGLDFRDLATGAVKGSLKPEDFVLGAAARNWRLKSPLLLSNSQSVPVLSEALTQR